MVVLNTITRPWDKREREKGVSESGGLLNPRENIHRTDIRGGGVQGEAGGGCLRRSSRPKSNWTPHPKEDPCERRRTLGAITMTARYRGLAIQGCFCPEECTGANGQGCGNTMSVVRTEHWVHVTRGRGLDLHPKYLRVRRDIPADMFFNNSPTTA